jgi:flagellar biosynthetic protein FlhB
VADDAGKTEKPTPKKLREARKEGQFPRTPDAAVWVGMAGGAALLPRTVGILSEQFRDLMAHLKEVAADPEPARALAVLAEVPRLTLLCIAPFAFAAASGAVLGAASQGVHPSGKMLKPKFSRMSPKAGIKRMFGMHAAWEAIKALLKVMVIAAVVWALGRSLIPDLVGAGIMPLAVTVQQTKSGLMTLLWATIATGLVLAVADYGYQRHTVMKQLKMSPREIKDEAKQAEGDPLIKGAIRSRQMAISRNRMLSAVADADVVLVNPTHIAVALKYTPQRGAPRVVARGTGGLALKIRERAREHRVPVVEDKPLARLLYRVCDLDDEIPAELYTAVAKVLAFVMAAGRPSRAAGARRPTSSTPLPDLPAKSIMRARRAREERRAKAGVAA